MLLRLIAIGNKMPAWINEGFQEYAKRLPLGYKLKLIEIPAEKRSKQVDIKRLTESEGEKILSLIKPGNLVISLDVLGKSWSTPQLAEGLQKWHDASLDVDLLVGGPDGLSANCLQKSQLKWSLSPLTLPHPLVRVVIAEQLYRAWSIIQKHPYHR